MNLYRNFGSTLEMWVATKDSEQEGKDSDVVQVRDKTPSVESDRVRRRSIREVRGVMLRSESEDSGVETENTPSTPGSLYHGFSPLREEPREFGDPWGSNRHSMPPLSSHSFTCVSLNTPALEETDTARSRVTVEQALRRASQSSTAGPNHTPPLGRADSTRHFIEHLRSNSMNTGQRSGGPRVRVADLLTATKQTPEPPQPPSSVQDPEPTPLEPHSTVQDLKPSPLQPNSSGSDRDPTPLQPNSSGSDQESTPVQPHSSAQDPKPSPLQPHSSAQDPKPSLLQPHSSGQDREPITLQPHSSGQDREPITLQPNSSGPDRESTPVQPHSSAQDPKPSPLQPHSSEQDREPITLQPHSSEQDREPITLQPHSSGQDREPITLQPHSSEQDREPITLQPHSSEQERESTPLQSHSSGQDPKPSPLEPHSSGQDPEPASLQPHSSGQDPEPLSLQPYPSRDETDSHSHCEDSTSLHASHREGAPTGKGPAPGLQLSPTLGPSAPRGPSLGLGYLEQVCRMLEEIAHLQLRNLELQRENERIRNRQCVHCHQKSSFDQHLPINPQNPVDVSQSSDCVDAPDQQSRERGPLRARERPISDIWELVRAQGAMEKEKRTHWSGRAGETSDGNEPSVAQEKRGRNHLGIRLKTGSLNRGTALLLSGRRLAGPSGKNGAKMIGLLFKKRGKNTPTG